MPRLTRLSRSVQGKVVLVTGAASGMGRATAHLFADEGAKVAVTDLQHEGVQAVVDEIAGAGGLAHGWTMDVRDKARIETVVGGDRGALRRARHRRQQRGHLALQPDRRARLRGEVGTEPRRAADRPDPR